MAWENVKSLDKGTATLWRDRTHGMWDVTADRGDLIVEPTDGLNHPRTRRAAIEEWRKRKAEKAANE
jgi:hypothetical protein